MRVFANLAAVIVVVFVVGACPKEPTKIVDAGTTRSASTEPSQPKRPPFPNMATAAWGQRVLEEKVAAVHVEGPAASQAVVLDALHDVSPGSEKRAAELAASWFKTATGDIDRGEACALLAVSLVLDPTVEGYKERLIDATGLAQYAGQLDPSSSLNQAARVVVWALAGQVDQAKRLLEVVETTPSVVPEARFFMALGQKLTGGKLDAALEDLDKALAQRPSSLRAKSLMAELDLDIGLYPEAIKAATVDAKDASTHPWLDALRGRALVLDGKVDDGVKLLKSCEDKLDEGRRGDALYWLGRSLTQKGADAEVDTIIASLSARPGYAKEAGVLEGLKLVKAGDYAKAREKIDALVKKGPMVLPVDVDAAWLLVDACAGAGDAECVARAGSRAVNADGDYARFNLARSALALVGKAPNIDVDEALKEAHRASPFDPELAKKVKEAVVDGGTAAANRVRAARRAIVRKSPKLVDKALAPLDKTASCRVCRALKAIAQPGGVDAANLAAKAVDGSGPPLCVADTIAVVHALGAAPTPEAKKALATFANDKREPIAKAYERANIDHKDPDTRRRQDAGDEHEHEHGGGPPPINVPPPPEERK